MTRDELVEAVAKAIYRQMPGWYVQKQGWPDLIDAAASAVDALVTPITAAIGKAIDDVAFEVFIDVDGHRSIGVDINHEGLAEAAKIARAWKPGPPVPMRDKRPLEPEVWGIDLTEEESEAYWKTMNEMRGSDDG